MPLVALAVLLLSPEMLNTKPLPVLADVFVGTHGPFRFLVDTGSETCLIDAKLASRLKLEPAFRTEIVTQNGSRLWPAVKLNTLRIGQRTLPESEVVFFDLTEARRLDPSVQGVLGARVLDHVAFSLFPRIGKLELAAERPSEGEAVPLLRREGRLAIAARMGNEELTFVLDSGASHIVLFRTPQAMTKTPPVATLIGTLDGARSAAPTRWTAELEFTTKLKIGTQPAAIVNRPNSEVDGLLPASLFRQIYIDQQRGEAILVR